MSDPKRIHIADIEDAPGFRITVDEMVFRARSLVVESAPFQPGTILWMSRASLDHNSSGAVVATNVPDWDEGPQEIVGFYVDRDGEQVGADLMEYMIRRNGELQEN